MNADPSDREAAVFNEARSLPPQRRLTFLDEACRGDAAIRRRIEELLRDHEEASRFLERPAAGLKTETPATEQLHYEKAGDKIGRYKLLQQIGEGGCGVVFMAEQEEPVRRRVALKVIKLGMDTKEVIARFEAERQALAMMDHPNIAKVLDAGATATGRPYFVMELVRGLKITAYCDQNNLSTDARLRLFVEVCDAIQHAHQKGIIHRDIKPSNVLVTARDGVAAPKVIDFGIAKATSGQPLTDKTLFTAFEQFLGTPAYMSPEQAEMSELGIDTRTDIYSLGILLYELLTGTTPFDAKELLAVGLDAMRRTIREKEPVRPSTRLGTMLDDTLAAIARNRAAEPPKLIHLLRGDLDWIVLKALEKDRARRYATANSLRMDIQRHLQNETILARPQSAWYRMGKTIGRNKLAFGAAAAVLISLILIAVIASIAAVRVQRDNVQIRKARDDATEKLWGSYLAEAHALRSSRQSGQRFESLEAVRNAAAIRGDLTTRNEAIASLAMSDLRVAKEAVLKGRPPDDGVRYDLKLENYYADGPDGSVTIRSVATDQTLGTLAAPGRSVFRLRDFSPDSRFLRVTYVDQDDHFSDWFWDTERQIAVLKDLPLGQPSAARGDIWSILAGDYSTDSRLLARSQPDGAISIYNLLSGNEVSRFSCPRAYSHLTFNPDNTQIACTSEGDPSVEIRAVNTGKVLHDWKASAPVFEAVWSVDGRCLTTASADWRITTWDVATGREILSFEGASDTVTSLARSHDGTLLASCGFDQVVRLWDASGRQVAQHPGSSWQLEFSAHDKELLGWTHGNHFGSLEVANSRDCRVLDARREGTVMTQPTFSPDGRLLASGAAGQVRFWDAASGVEIASFFRDAYNALLFSADGTRLFISDGVGVWQSPLERKGLAYALGKPSLVFAVENAGNPVLSADGRYLALCHATEDEALVYDLQNPTAKPLALGPSPRADHIAISPDGRWVATASWNNSLVKAWDARSGQLAHTFEMPSRAVVDFSPDGRWLATSSSEYQLWETGSWKPRAAAMPGDPVAERNFTVFSPEGRLMARLLAGNKIGLFDLQTLKPVATLEAPDAAPLTVLRFSPDGTRLAACQGRQKLQLWDLRLIRRELAQVNLDWDLPPYPPAAEDLEKIVTLEIAPP